MQPHEDDLGQTPGPASSVYKLGGEFPWWLVAMLTIIGFMTFLVFSNEDYREAFDNILPWPPELYRGIGLSR